MLPLLFLIGFREVQEISYANYFTEFTDFGILENGTVNMAFELLEGNNAKIQVCFLEEAAWYNLFAWTSDYICGKYCSDWNYTTSDLTSSYVTTAPTKMVVYPVIIHCDHRSNRDVRYRATFTYDNLETKLDYREVPNLITLPSVIGYMVLVLIVWILASVLKHRRFSLLHVVITGLIVLYVVSLCATCGVYYHDDKSDSYSPMRYFVIVIDGIFWALLFIFLICAASGWGTMSHGLTMKKVTITVVSCIAAVASTWVVRYVTLGWKVILVVAIFGIACFFASREITSNYDDAMRRVNAHLLSISRQGINPVTTPVYIKYKTYHMFLYLLTGSIIVFFALSVILAYARAEQWLDYLAFNVFQASLVTIIAIMYRPRGPNVDIYMRQDDEDGGDRDAIQLEDLTDFHANNAYMQSLKAWDGRERLPLQPIIIGSAPQSTGSRYHGRQDTVYMEPLVNNNA